MTQPHATLYLTSEQMGTLRALASELGFTGPHGPSVSALLAACARAIEAQGVRQAALCFKPYFERQIVHRQDDMMNQAGEEEPGHRDNEK